MSTKIRNGQGEAPMKGLQTSGLEAKSMRKCSKAFWGCAAKRTKGKLGEHCSLGAMLLPGKVDQLQHSTVESLFKMRTENSPLDLVMSGHRWPWLSSFGRVVGKKPNWSVFTFTFHFHALVKEMKTHSSVLAWRIPGTREPGGLSSIGSHRVGHYRGDLAAAARENRMGGV